MALVGDFKLTITNLTGSPISFEDISTTVSDPGGAGYPTVAAGPATTLELIVTREALVSWEKGRIKEELDAVNITAVGAGLGGAVSLDGAYDVVSTIVADAGPVLLTTGPGDVLRLNDDLQIALGTTPGTDLTLEHEGSGGDAILTNNEGDFFFFNTDSAQFRFRLGSSDFRIESGAALASQKLLVTTAGGMEIRENLLRINKPIQTTVNQSFGFVAGRFQNANDASSGDTIEDLAVVTSANQAHTGLSIFQLKLGASESASDDTYNDYWVEITSGLHNGEVRQLTDYTGATRVATLASAWTPQALSGTHTINTTINVVGVGSLYLTELAIGDKITIAAEQREVAGIGGDLNLTVTSPFVGSSGGNAGTSDTPRPGSTFNLHSRNYVGLALNQISNDWELFAVPTEPADATTFISASDFMGLRLGKLVVDNSTLGPNTIKIKETATSPTADTDSGFVYAKDVSTVTELFYKASDGTETQLTGTSGGAVPDQLQHLSDTHTVTNLDGTVTVSQFAFDASQFSSEYSQFAFRVVGSATAGQTGTVQLYNLTDTEAVNTQTFNTTVPTKKEGTLTVGVAAGNLKTSEKIYEVRVSVSGSTVAHTTTMGSAVMRMQV